jgi:hypothetical protein
LDEFAGMQYIFHTLIPIPWLLADLLTVAITMTVIVLAVKQTRHPASILLEGFGFVFLYAAVFENFAVVQNWYIYGRSLLMIGDVPLSVPLIEMDVLIVGLWLLEKMQIPTWCKPFVVGLFGMLQDLSLDPVSINQVYTVQGATSGRWTWLVPEGMVNIYKIPVYNFPGWMLIMLYGSTFILLGRAWFKRSGYKPSVGYVYPLLAAILALLAMVSPLSQFLLWMAPIGVKGNNYEWVMLAFHLLFPFILLAVFWRGRMKNHVSLKDDFPVFAVFILFHLADILFAITARYTNVLWLVVLASLIHFGLLAIIVWAGRNARLMSAEFVLDPG